MEYDVPGHESEDESVAGSQVALRVDASARLAVPLGRRWALTLTVDAGLAPSLLAYRPGSSFPRTARRRPAPPPFPAWTAACASAPRERCCDDPASPARGPPTPQRRRAARGRRRRDLGALGELYDRYARDVWRAVRRYAARTAPTSTTSSTRRSSTCRGSPPRTTAARAAATGCAASAFASRCGTAEARALQRMLGSFAQTLGRSSGPRSGAASEPQPGAGACSSARSARSARRSARCSCWSSSKGCRATRRRGARPSRR